MMRMVALFLASSAACNFCWGQYLFLHFRRVSFLLLTFTLHPFVGMFRGFVIDWRYFLVSSFVRYLMWLEIPLLVIRVLGGDFVNGGAYLVSNVSGWYGPAIPSTQGGSIFSVIFEKSCIEEGARSKNPDGSSTVLIILTLLYSQPRNL